MARNSTSQMSLENSKQKENILLIYSFECLPVMNSLSMSIVTMRVSTRFHGSFKRFNLIHWYLFQLVVILKVLSVINSLNHRCSQLWFKLIYRLMICFRSIKILRFQFEFDSPTTQMVMLMIKLMVTTITFILIGFIQVLLLRRFARAEC